MFSSWREPHIKNILSIWCFLQLLHKENGHEMKLCEMPETWNQGGLFSATNLKSFKPLSIIEVNGQQQHRGKENGAAQPYWNDMHQTEDLQAERHGNEQGHDCQSDFSFHFSSS